MTDFEILGQLIRDSARVQVDGKTVELSEPQHNYSVRIGGLPKEIFVIKVDEFKAPSSIFNGSKGECKRADFMIIAASDHKRFIVCIEMKANKSATETEIIEQLKGAKCFADYCQTVGRSFWGESEFLKKYEFRFVSLRKISIAKQETRLKPVKGIHNVPERMLKINSPQQRQEFNKLVGK